MRHSRLAVLLLAICAALPAGAEGGLLAVMQLDVRMAGERMTEPARVAMEEMLRDVAANKLSAHGWKILTGDNQVALILDNGIDPAECDLSGCHLDVARQIGVNTFISGVVQWVEGEFVASVRLLDAASGRILASERLEGPTTRALRHAFESKAQTFFARSGLIPDAPAPEPVAPAVPSFTRQGPQIVSGKPTAAVGDLTIDVRPREGVRLEIADPTGRTFASGVPYKEPQAAPGRWTVTARARGFEDEVRSFEVPADEIVLTRLELRALGGLVIGGTPEGARVTVTGPEGFNHRGAIPWEARGIRSGTYRVEVSRPSYLPRTQEVVVHAGRVSQVSIDLMRESEAERQARRLEVENQFAARLEERPLMDFDVALLVGTLTGELGGSASGTGSRMEFRFQERTRLGWVGGMGMSFLFGDEDSIEYLHVDGYLTGGLQYAVNDWLSTYSMARVGMSSLTFPGVELFDGPSLGGLTMGGTLGARIYLDPEFHLVGGLHYDRGPEYSAYGASIGIGVPGEWVLLALGILAAALGGA